jgi:hypothetical protein
MFPMQVRAARVTKRIHEAYFAQLYLSKVNFEHSSPVMESHTQKNPEDLSDSMTCAWYRLEMS